MASPADQVRPNQITFQLNFKPNPRIMSHFGDLAADLCSGLDFVHWRVSPTRLDVHNEGDTRHVFITHNVFAYLSKNVDDPDAYHKCASSVLTRLLDFSVFEKSPYVARIGVRPRFLTKFSGSFEQLRDRVKDRYVNITKKALEAISTAGTTSLTDIGAPLYFKDQHGDFNTHCGPMKPDQSGQFFPDFKPEELPDVALYFDNDYYITPDREMSASEIAKKIGEFLSTAWSRHQQVRKLIVGP